MNTIEKRNLFKYGIMPKFSLSEEQEKYIELHKLQEKKDYIFIKNFLNNKGIIAFRSNKYWYKFIYNEMEVCFVNQTTRLCGKIHRILNDEERYHISKDFLTIRSQGGSQYSDFKKEFKYRHFVFEDKLENCLTNIFNLIK